MQLIMQRLLERMAIARRPQRHSPTWHYRCIFSYRSFVCPWGVGMKLKVRAIGLAVAMFLSTSAALAPRVLAQDASPDAVKRKVKTRVVPDFPPLARQLNVTGKVKIEVTISADGRVTSTKVVGGSPVLVGSALDAVKRWRFEAAPKETSEIIEFSFN
jgi:TonB family protein